MIDNKKDYRRLEREREKENKRKRETVDPFKVFVPVHRITH